MQSLSKMNLDKNYDGQKIQSKKFYNLFDNFIN